VGLNRAPSSFSFVACEGHATSFCLVRALISERNSHETAEGILHVAFTLLRNMSPIGIFERRQVRVLFGWMISVMDWHGFGTVDWTPWA
jgi:hypothetical protein